MLSGVVMTCVNSPGVQSDDCFGPCSGHGTCRAVAANSSTVECVCDTNGNFNASTSCSTCLTGWGTYNCDKCAKDYFGADCTRCKTNNATGLVCSGHGTCFDGLSGNGTCACDANFAGQRCFSDTHTHTLALSLSRPHSLARSGARLLAV